MIDPTDVLRTFGRVTTDVQRLASLFDEPEGVGRRFLLGCNEDSTALSNVFDIDGFVDDYAKPGTVWNNKPVLKGEDVPKDAVLVNCSTSISPVSVSKRIEGLGLFGTLNYSDLSRVFADRVPLQSFVRETRRDLEEHWDKWKTLSDALADEISRQVFDDLLTFRLTGDCVVMNGYSVRLQDQYFEDFLMLGSGEVFVDAGGYDGDTTAEFCRRCPDYKKIFLFEPSSQNLQKAKERMQGVEGIEFVDRGLSNSFDPVWFDPNAGSASSVCASGSLQINMVTLDQQVQEKVTFIKMDLEGWEHQALEGSRRHILEDHPKLAIAVYHHPSDFWRIFEFVLDIREDYDVYLRHYTEGWSETVMFFIPRPA